MYLILFIFSFNSWAQYESVFGDSATSWNLFEALFDGITTDSLYTVKDSIIDSVTYTTIEFEEDIKYFLRESEDNSKVYFYCPFLSDSIFTVLDLTLQKADTFYINTIYAKTPIIADTVYIKEGRKHIRFDYEIDYDYGGNENFEFIEGVGTNFGLFYPVRDWERNYLLCSYKDKSLVYINNSNVSDFNGKCKVFWTDINKYESSHKISVYPNPAKKTVTFKFDKENYSNNYSIKIYNAYGTLCKTLNNNHGYAEMNIAHLPAGIYLYEIRSNSKNFNGKLIIQ